MPSDRGEVIVAKIRALQSDGDLAKKICHVGVEILGARAVSLALVVSNSYSSISSSDDLAVVLDEQQFALGDGPTFDAQRSTMPVLVEDVEKYRDRRESPAFASIAAQHGIHAVFAFPLRIGNAYLGVMTAYRGKPGALTAEQYADGLLLSSMATAELVRLQAGAEPNGLFEIFEVGLHDQSALQVAAGMVAESLNCSIVEALVRIRAKAFAEGKPLNSIANQIVAKETKIAK